MANYTIYDNGQVEQGNARALLESIRERAAENNPEIARMSVDQYANALIEDAEYFLPDKLLEALKKQDFGAFDRALTYLSNMPTSGIRILKVA